MDAPLSSSEPNRWMETMRRRRWGAVAWTVVVVAVLCLNAGAIASEVSKEYKLKAAFLYNFTKFVEWPPGKFPAAESPVIIGVLGHNPFGEVLGETVKNRSVNGRPVQVVQLASVREAAAVHVVFVSKESEAMCAELEKAEHPGVLTVAEVEQTRACGAVIHFRTIGDKVRFEIDIGAAETSGLKLSAHLQKLATAVHRPNSK